jgi:hemerythrin
LWIDEQAEFMTSLRWVAPFDLNVPVLDSEHRILYHLARSAIVALQLERIPSAALALASLADSTRAHFEAEEQMMRTSAFSGYYNHCEQHRRLLLALERLQAALALRRASVGYAIHELRSWMTLHIVTDDRYFATHLARQSAKTSADPTSASRYPCMTPRARAAPGNIEASDRENGYQACVRTGRTGDP